MSLKPETVRFAWKHGELSYRLRNGQKKARLAVAAAHEKFLKFYLECTRRFGKSTYGLVWLSEDCIKNPGSVSAFFAPVKEGLRDYVLPIISQTFSDCPDDLRPTLDATLTLTFPNGSKIMFRGSNNQQHRVRRGNAFRRVFVDEGRDVDDLDNLVDSVIIPSLFSTMGRLLISSTPADTEDHPLHAIKQAAEREGWYFRFTILDAHRYDPLDFPLARIETWERETSDKVAWQREYMALWVKDPTKTVIPEWDDSYIQTIERDEFFPYYQKYVSMDLGVRDKTAAIFGYYDFKRAKLIIESEFTMKDAEVLTDNIAAKIKETERALGYQLIHDRDHEKWRSLQTHEKVYRRVADNNNPLLVQDLNSKHGMDFFGTRKDELPAMINLCREFVKDGRIIVDSKCVELIGCLRNGVWDKHKRELARSKVYGHFDALMSLVYLVRNVDTGTNPIPKFFGKTWATHSGVPMNASDPMTGHEVLSKIFQVKTQRDSARESFAKGQVG